MSATKLINNIRNVAFISSSNHGCTTLIDAILSKCGATSSSKIATNDKTSEYDKKPTKSKYFTLQYEHSIIVADHLQDITKNKHKKTYLLNMIDTPGSTSFISEAMSSIILVDGVVVVVDCIYGVSMTTEHLLKYSINQELANVLFINKLDLMLSSVKFKNDQIYIHLRSLIQSLNVISGVKNEAWPEYGKVAFGSAKYQYGFTLKTFAILYASRFGIPVKKMMTKLWGNNYWNHTKKRWVKKNETSKLLRGFDQFVLQPLRILHQAILSGQHDIYEPIIAVLGLNIPSDELQQLKSWKNYKELLRLMMNKWLPVSDVLFDMIIRHLPSPVMMSEDRCKKLYTGPWTTTVSPDLIKNQIKLSLSKYDLGKYLFCVDILCQYTFYETELTKVKTTEAVAMTYCNPESPLIMYITKLIPSASNRFIAFGRIFSGKLKKKETVWIMGPDYHGRKKDLYSAEIEKILLMSGDDSKEVTSCSAGRLCGIVGIDEYITEYATLSNDENIHPLRKLNHNIPTVISVNIEPKNASGQDLATLLQNLKSIIKYNPTIRFNTSTYISNSVSFIDQFHLDNFINDLKTNDLNITVSEPFTGYRETINSLTGYDEVHPKICRGKSPNKHTRLYGYAEPLNKKFIDSLCSGDIDTSITSLMSHKMKAFGRKLRNDYEWDIGAARKIWTFGSTPDAVANCLVDATKGVQFLNEIKDPVIGAFKMVTSSGVLCDEPLYGIRINITDVTLCSDAIHRGGGQIIPCAKKMFYACQLASTPRLMEPMYLVEIITGTNQLSGVYNLINMKRGEICKMDGFHESISMCIEVFIPVSECYDLSQLLHKTTGGQASVCIKFSHWKTMISDPMKEDSLAHDILMDIRKRKGRKQKLPEFIDYYDKY